MKKFIKIIDEAGHIYHVNPEQIACVEEKDKKLKILFAGHRLKDGWEINVHNVDQILEIRKAMNGGD